MANKRAIREREQEAQEQQSRVREQLRRSAARTAESALTPEQIGQSVYARYAEHNPLRGPETFKRTLKTRDQDRIGLAYLLHMFTDYKVPNFLQRAMLQLLVKMKAMLARGEDEKLKAFFIVGQGKSLYKELLKDKLSKKEVHTFLTCPFDIEYDEAQVYAMAKSFTDNNGTALRMSKTRLAQGAWTVKLGHPLFRETVRFFTQHDVPLKQINDLCDYIFRKAVITEDGKFNHEWSFRGRTPASLEKQMIDWHHELRRAQSIGGGNWEGITIPDTIYEKVRAKSPAGRDVFVDWRVSQIKTGDELAKEGTAMHHCVASYKQSCLRGTTGIFSVRSSLHGCSSWERHLTVEVIRGGAGLSVVQVRGFANRAAKPDERAIVKQWANEHDLNMTRYC